MRFKPIVPFKSTFSYLNCTFWGKISTEYIQQDGGKPAETKPNAEIAISKPKTTIKW